MKKYTLNGQARDLVGRKVKNLRMKGVMPATVYGKKMASQTISVAASDFTKVHAAAGETGLIELTVGGSVSPVLIHNVQRNAINGDVLHVEFYHVDLKEKVHTKVPLVHAGESPVVNEKKGVILTLLSEVEVEALPTDLPEKIEVDVSTLTEVDQELKVSDLKVPAGVTLLTDATVGVVKVGALVSREAEEQAAAEAVAATTEAAEGAEAAAGAAEKSGDKAEESAGDTASDNKEKKE